MCARCVLPPRGLYEVLDNTIPCGLFYFCLQYAAGLFIPISPGRRLSQALRWACLTPPGTDLSGCHPSYPTKLTTRKRRRIPVKLSQQRNRSRNGRLARPAHGRRLREATEINGPWGGEGGSPNLVSNMTSNEKIVWRGLGPVYALCCVSR